MALSLGFKKSSEPAVKRVEDQIFAIAKANKIFWNGINRDDVIEKIKAGYMIGFGPEAAEIGRKFTNRGLPYRREELGAAHCHNFALFRLRRGTHWLRI